MCGTATQKTVCKTNTRPLVNLVQTLRSPASLGCCSGSMLHPPTLLPYAATWEASNITTPLLDFLNRHVYVYMYMYVHIYTAIYIYTHICIYIYMGWGISPPCIAALSRHFGTFETNTICLTSTKTPVTTRPFETSSFQSIRC